MLREVYIPSIVSSAVASLRLGATFSLLAAVVAELVASDKGIGFEILTAQGNLQNDYVMAGVLIIACLSFAVDRLLVILERHLMAWKVGT
jgi:ABC-type nitrate/sulfonate/bicarbonate transport system permease component